MRRSLLLFALLLSLVGCDTQERERGHEPAVAAIPHYEAAVRLMARGKMDPALERVEQAIEIDPRYAEAWVAKGNILAAQDNTLEAAEALDQAIAIRPDFPEAAFLKGLLLDRGGEAYAAREAYAEAIALFDKAADEGLEQPRRAVQRAVAVYLKEGSVRGHKAIDQVLRKYPNYARARLVKKRIDEGERSAFLGWFITESAAETL